MSALGRTEEASAFFLRPVESSDGQNGLGCCVCCSILSNTDTTTYCHVCAKPACMACSQHRIDGVAACDLCVLASLKAKVELYQPDETNGAVDDTVHEYDPYSTSHISDDVVDIYYLDGYCKSFYYTTDTTIRELAQMFSSSTNIALFEVEQEVGHVQDHHLLYPDQTLCDVFKRWSTLNWTHAKLLAPIYFQDWQTVAVNNDHTYGHSAGPHAHGHTAIEKELLSTMHQIKQLTQYDYGPELVLPPPPIMISEATNTPIYEHKTICTDTDDFGSITTSASTQSEWSTSDCGTDACEVTVILCSVGTNTDPEPEPTPPPVPETVDAGCDACFHPAVADSSTSPDLALSQPAQATAACSTDVFACSTVGTETEAALVGPILHSAGSNTDLVAYHDQGTSAASPITVSMGTSTEVPPVLVSSAMNTDARTTASTGTDPSSPALVTAGTATDPTMTGPQLQSTATNTTAAPLTADAGCDAPPLVVRHDQSTAVDAVALGAVSTGCNTTQVTFSTTGTETVPSAVQSIGTDTERVQMISTHSNTITLLQSTVSVGTDEIGCKEVGTEVDAGMTGPRMVTAYSNTAAVVYADAECDAHRLEQRTIATEVDTSLTGPFVVSTATETDHTTTAVKFTNTPRIRVASAGTETAVVSTAAMGTSIDPGMTGPAYTSTGSNTPHVRVESTAVGTDAVFVHEVSTDVDLSLTGPAMVATASNTVVVQQVSAGTEVDWVLRRMQSCDADTCTPTVTQAHAAVETVRVDHHSAGTETERELVGPIMLTTSTSTTIPEYSEAGTSMLAVELADRATSVDPTLTGPTMATSCSNTEAVLVCNTGCAAWTPTYVDQSAQVQPQQQSVAISAAVNVVDSGTDAVPPETASFGTDIDVALVGPVMCERGSSPISVPVCTTGCDADTPTYASAATDIDLSLTGPEMLTTATNTNTVVMTSTSTDPVPILRRSIGSTVDTTLTGPRMRAAGVNTTAVELQHTGCNPEPVITAEAEVSAVSEYCDAACDAVVEVVSQGCDSGAPEMVDCGCDADHEPADWDTGEKGYLRRRESVKHYVSAIETCLQLQRSRSTSNPTSPMQSQEIIQSPDSPSKLSVATLPEHERDMVLPIGTNIAGTSHLHHHRGPTGLGRRRAAGSTYSSPRLGSPGTGRMHRTRLTDRSVIQQMLGESPVSSNDPRSPVTPPTADSRRRDSAGSALSRHSSDAGGHSPLSQQALGTELDSPGRTEESNHASPQTAAVAVADEAPRMPYNLRRRDNREGYHPPATVPQKPGHSDWSKAKRLL